MRPRTPASTAADMAALELVRCYRSHSRRSICFRWRSPRRRCFSCCGWMEPNPTRAAWRGFLFGLGLFGVGVSWVYVSLHNFGHMPVPLAALATFLFVVVLVLYPALLGFIQARWCNQQRPTHALLVLPALWVLFEWVRSWFLTGFPWLNLGYSQSDTWLCRLCPRGSAFTV